MAREGNKVVTPSHSIIAGGVAGGIESLVTYPTEYVKTRKQLHSSSDSIASILINTVRKAGFGGLYAGAGAFVASNASKSGVRFFTFDLVKTWLPRDEKTHRPTKAASMVAGVAAGVAESVTVVTPGENIKTRIIQDRAEAGAEPKRLRTTAQVVREILAKDGIRGAYRGVLPVTIKQGSNALVRFTSYTVLLGIIESRLKDTRLSGLSPAIAGALAGVVTVFDVVKTKMQALAGGAEFAGRAPGTLGCFTEVVRKGGLAALWKGTTPRLARLSISGAISFSIYEKVTELLQAVPSGGSVVPVRQARVL